MKILAMLAVAILMAGCGSKSAEDKIRDTTKKVYALNADERSLADANAKTYFERQWINAGNERGQFLNCRPSDSNFNGYVSCFGLIPQPNKTFQQVKMYCGYRPELVGCSDEDSVK